MTDHIDSNSPVASPKPPSSHLVVLPAALAAAVLVSGVLDWLLPVFSLPSHLVGLSGNGVTSEQLAELHIASAAVRGNNAIAALVVVAAVLAVVLVALDWWANRSKPAAGFAALRTAIVASVVAAVLAVGAGSLGSLLVDRWYLPDHRLLKSVAVQAAAFSLIGLGVGLGTSLGRYGPKPVAARTIAGALGGLLAALAFPVVAGLVLPSVNTEFLFPDAGLGRLLWVALPSGLIAITVTELGRGERR